MEVLDELTIRAMQEADIDQVLFNERASFTHPWSEGVFEDCITNGNSCWVLLVKGGIIGHGILSFGGGEAHVLNVCVNPDYQGKGYGRILVEYLVDQARSQEVSNMFLEVRVSNQVAYQLYEKLGFNEVGIRENYYPSFNGREDAFVLAIELV